MSNEPTGLMDAVRVIFTRVERIDEKVNSIDASLRGSEDGTVVGFGEQIRTNSFCIRKVKEEQKVLRKEMEDLRAEVIDKPREEQRQERRGVVRDALSGGIGGIIVLAATAVWGWATGK